MPAPSIIPDRWHAPPAYNREQSHGSSALAMPWPFGAIAQIMLGAEDWWRWSGLASPICSGTHASPALTAQLATQRCNDLIHFARRRSPLYSKRLRHFPEKPRLEDLPVFERDDLMSGFDDWVTDPALSRRALEEFIADPARRGEPYLGRYAVWTSSGTSGIPGLYVQDPAALATYEALLTMRTAGQCGAQLLWRTLAGAGRLAMIAATDGHFAGVVSWERLCRLHPWLAVNSRVFSVTRPTAELVATLNAWQPALLSSYPSMLSLLGDELAQGRLRIRPLLLWSGGEELCADEASRLRSLFGCPVFEEYGASECMNIAFSCEHGSLHLHADWVILEPIDAQGRLVEPGVASSDVLLTNLCNRVQPLIRYRLGDSITMVPGLCECGCPLPRLRVEGRRDDCLQFESETGSPVTLVPLAIESAIEEGTRVHQFQVMQVGARHLRVRVAAPAGLRRSDAWQSVQARLKTLLAAHGAGSVRLSLDPLAPQPHPSSGKLHRVQGIRHLGGRHRPHTARDGIIIA